MSLPTTTVEVEFTAGVWTDVSAYVRAIDIQRGRSSELDTFSAGRCRIRLDNRDRRFDPVYTSSPYSPNVKPMKRIRVKATWSGTTYNLYNGYVDGWPQTYVDNKDAWVDVSATDAFKVFQAAQLPSVWEQTVRSTSFGSLGLAAWWRFGEQAGTKAKDSFSTHDGRYEGGATFNTRTGLVAHDEDNAIEFTGSATAKLPYAPSSYPFTISFWYQHTTALGSFNTATLMDVGDVDRASFIVGGPSISPKLKFGLYGGTAYQEWYANGVDVTDGSVHHIVAVVTNGTTVSLYVDGVDRTASWAGSGTPTAPDGGTTTVYASGQVLDELAIHTQTLSASQVDGFYDAGTAPWDGDLTSARISRVLDYLSWPAPDRDIFTGKSTVVEADVEGARALDHMQKVTLSEGGNIFISASGAVYFRDRHASFTYSPYRTSIATFGDGAGELPYQDIELEYDDAHIRNEVWVKPASGTSQVAKDDTSISTYQRHSYRRELLSESETEARDAAHYLLGRYKEPYLRVTGMTVNPHADEANLYPQVLGRELGERITVKRRPQAVGSAIDQQAHIEGIRHRITPAKWETTYALSPAETVVYWRLGHADDGQLGNTTRLAY